MEWVVNALALPLYPRELTGTQCIRGWMGSRASLDGCGKFARIGNRSQDCSGRSESLYRLRYPGPCRCNLYCEICNACSLGLYVLKGRLEAIIWLESKVTIESLLAESTFESKMYTHFVRYKKQQ